MITKDGKVSCECCDEGECIFYPAIGMQQGFYTQEDLPDDILFKFENDFVLFSKTDDSFYATIQDELSGDVYFRITPIPNENPIWEPGQSNFNILWRLQQFTDQGWQTIEEAEPAIALFSFAFADIFTKSLYAETYLISGPISGTVERVPPPFEGASETCEWIGEDLILRYNSRFSFDPLYIFSGNFKWQVNGKNKTGNQNTPVGSYEGGYSVS